MQEVTERYFAGLEIRNWRQFDRVSVTFHSRVTILTGANGSGKTTLLNLLSKHFGWSLPFVAAPSSRKGQAATYLAERRKRSERAIYREGQPESIGRLTYSDGTHTEMLANASTAPTYDVSFPNANEVAGVYITSHRPVTWYEQVASIPTAVGALDAVLNQYLNDYRSRYQRTASPSPGFRIKEALISWAAFGPESRLAAGNSGAVAAFDGFTSVLRQVLPRTLGFERLMVSAPEVVLQTRSGDVAFDSVSGGIAALVDLSWQVYLYSLLRSHFTVLIDEPENHLHPELQRTVLPAFVRAFPNQRFVVSTHNPLVVGSVEDSYVYVLRHEQARRVRSRPLERRSKAGSANEILRDVLGVESSIPVWAEQEVDELVRRLDSNELGVADAEELRRELTRLGLADLMPLALERWLAIRNE